MKLPELEAPDRYAGLYVFDFGDQVAVGYTANEIAVLLESEQYAEGKVYRIHRALPDGTMELAGVSRERFQLEDGLFFYRATLEAAREDFEALRRLAGDDRPPCRIKVHLASMPGPASRFVTAAIFPAEFTQDVSDWLIRIGFEGGDLVEGGPSQVTGHYSMQMSIQDRLQLESEDRLSRSPEEVLATTHLPIQRKLA